MKLLLLGNPESNAYMSSLEEQYIRTFDGRVSVMEAVSHNQLWKYVGAADLCVVPIIPKCRSYYFALPNKLFEAIQAETALLVSDLPEMRKIVEKYNIGGWVNTKNIEAFRSKIVEIKEKGREPYIKGLLKAKEELTFEKETKILKRAYSVIMERNNYDRDITA